jgi:tetratricopeptide (TPR) repeat protein
MQDPFGHIENYLTGNLSEEEYREFEARLKDDPSLKEQMEKQQAIITGIRLGFNRELKSLLQKEEQQLRETSTQTDHRTNPFKLSIGIAAAMALIIASVVVFKYMSLDSRELYAKYYKPYPNIESPVTRSGKQDNTAFVFYEQGEYEKALERFTELLKKSPRDPALIFYSGTCYLELDNARAAIPFFKQINSFIQSKLE